MKNLKSLTCKQDCIAENSAASDGKKSNEKALELIIDCWHMKIWHILGADRFIMSLLTNRILILQFLSIPVKFSTRY